MTTYSGYQSFGRQFSEEANKQAGTRIYIVKSDEPVLELPDVLDYSGLPTIGESWDMIGYQGLQCVRRIPQEIEKENQLFNVICEYETDSSYLAEWDISITSKQKQYTPWQTETSWSQVEGPQYLDHNKYYQPGNQGPQAMAPLPAMNRAGQYFKPAITEIRYVSVITMTKTINSISEFSTSITDINTLQSYQGTMNNSAQTIAGIEGDTWCFKILDISFNRLRQTNKTYDTKITIKVEYDPQTHAKVVANTGYEQIKLKQGSGDKAPFSARNADGTRGSKPSILDTDGKTLNIGPDEYDFENGPPYYIVLPFIKETTFEDLELPAVWE